MGTKLALFQRRGLSPAVGRYIGWDDDNVNIHRSGRIKRGFPGVKTSFPFVSCILKRENILLVIVCSVPEP